MNRQLKTLSAILFVLISLWSGVVCAHLSQVSSLNLGVLSYREPEKTRHQSQPLVNYLNSQISGIHIHLRVLNNEQFKTALRRHQVDLLLINPSLYEVVRSERSLSGAIATVQRSYHGQVTSALGGVVFTRANRKDIHQYADLLHKTVAIPSTSNMGAYRIPLYELRKRGINTQKIHFVSVGTNDEVVKRVLDGQADVGFVRTGILEAWQADGKLNLSALKVIHSRQLKGYPYLVSTPLYPEWPFVVVSSIKVQQVKQLIVALYNYHPKVNQIEGISGFVPPVDYLPVQHLLKTLRVSSYERNDNVDLIDIWHHYSTEVVLSVLLLITMIFALLGTLYFRQKQHNTFHELKRLVKATRIGIWQWDLKTNHIEVNSRVFTKLGYKRTDYQLSNKQTLMALAHPAMQAPFDLALETFVQGKIPFLEQDVRMRHQQGYWLWVQIRGVVIERDKFQKPTKIAGTLINIDDLKTQQLRLHLEAKRSALILALDDVLEEQGEMQMFHAMNEALKNIFSSELSFAYVATNDLQALDQRKVSHTTSAMPNVAQCWKDNSVFFGEPQDERGFALLETFIQTAIETQQYQLNQQVTAEWVEGIHPKGAFDLQDASKVIRDILIIPIVDQNQLVMVLGIANKAEPYGELDMETLTLIGKEVWHLVEKKRSQQKLSFIAHYDTLTGLPNRSLFSESVRQAFLQAKRRQEMVALVFIDLDGFKQVNDHYGHDAGDYVLIEIAQRFKSSVRETDIVARLGGDEFVAVLTEVLDSAEIERVLERLLSAANESLDYHGQSLKVSASIGVSFYQADSDLDVDQVLRQADQAMYQAKQAGKNKVVYFESFARDRFTDKKG